MSTPEPLTHADADRKLVLYRTLGRRRRRLRRTLQAGGGTLSAVAIVAALVWSTGSLSGLRHEAVTTTTPGPTAITTGWLHSCALTPSGAALCWGGNRSGQLGDGTRTYKTVPTPVVGLTEGVAAISAGGLHTCALTTQSAVWCWGSNRYGQLGLPKTTASPREVPGLTSGVVAISAGTWHTCAVTDAGGVKCWGYNDHGQLGNGTKTDSSTPVDVTGLTSGVAAIAAGREHTCAVTTAGAALCWGYDNSDQLGALSTVDRTTPVPVRGLPSDVVAVTGGWFHSCALTASQAIWCWGTNYHGELGIGDRSLVRRPVTPQGYETGAAAVSAGGFDTCALNTAGGLQCWGYDDEGWLGTGGTKSHPSPQDVVGLSSGVAAVSAGRWHTCAIGLQWQVWCWGSSGGGAIGDGSGPRGPDVHTPSLAIPPSPAS